VLFAVNLLKDSKGAINLELPISGSLDDPQFEIGALVGQVVSNLLKKAITSPFSLLTSGASEDLTYVEFEPGRDQIGAANEKKLDAVAKALLDRPAVKLEMASHSDAQKDLAALKRASLHTQLKATDDAQYAALVKAQYQRAKAAEKPASKEPAKDASPAEMEAFLLERVQVGEVELRALAARRSEQVKSYLVGKGQLPADRVLIATSEAPEKSQASRVDFTLK
jgi:outer membrane protein OmpA-like peptidoglycan-associated protein